MEEKLHELAARLRELREVCDYTPEQLAKELGIDVNTYLGYEKDGYNIPINIIFQIANKFGVDFNELLSGESGKLTTYHVVRAGKGITADRYPGYHFKVMDALITNFHLPESTLLMLVSAFSSREIMLKAYQTAIENEYRFFSFGDACLIQ